MLAQTNVCLAKINSLSFCELNQGQIYVYVCVKQIVYSALRYYLDNTITKGLWLHTFGKIKSLTLLWTPKLLRFGGTKMAIYLVVRDSIMLGACG